MDDRTDRWTSVKACSGAETWTRAERFVFLLSTIIICALAYLYCFHMWRHIPFDEVGLHNPIYMYYTTGHMTYPMHGQPDFMTVHPPTHYFVTALLMKAGLTLFKASAAPLFVLTIVSALLIYRGGLSFPTAMALLLGFFLGTFIWASFYTIRPDLIVSFSWFAGLVALQSAKNKNWSEWRLFLGAALSVLAACMHYWGIVALFGIVWFGLVLIYERRSSPRTLIRPIAAMAAGALVIRAPYLVLFVIPRLSDIMAMVSGAQNPGGRTAGPVQAYQRHMESYGGLAQNLIFVPPVRWLTSVLTAPVLDWGIPAVFVGPRCWRFGGTPE
jgi:hypothetical protein